MNLSSLNGLLLTVSNALSCLKPNIKLLYNTYKYIIINYLWIIILDIAQRLFYFLIINFAVMSNLELLTQENKKLQLAVNELRVLNDIATTITSTQPVEQIIDSPY